MTEVFVFFSLCKFFSYLNILKNIFIRALIKILYNIPHTMSEVSVWLLSIRISGLPEVLALRNRFIRIQGKKLVFDAMILFVWAGCTIGVVFVRKINDS